MATLLTAQAAMSKPCQVLESPDGAKTTILGDLLYDGRLCPVISVKISSNNKMIVTYWETDEKAAI